MNSTHAPAGEVAARVGGAAWLLTAALLGLAAVISTLVSEWMWAAMGAMAVGAATIGFWLPGTTWRAGRVSLWAGVLGLVAASIFALLAPGTELFWFVAAAQALAVASSLLLLRRLRSRSGGLDS